VSTVADPAEGGTWAGELRGLRDSVSSTSGDSGWSTCSRRPSPLPRARRKAGEGSRSPSGRSRRVEAPDDPIFW